MGGCGFLNRRKLIAFLAKVDALFQEMLRKLHTEFADNMVSDITPNQLMVLQCINDTGKATVSEVAGRIGVSLSAISAQVERLHRMGIVDRERDPDDRRVVWLFLTEDGRNLVATCMESRLKVVERYLGRLPQEDLNKLMDICTNILSIMREEEESK